MCVTNALGNWREMLQNFSPSETLFHQVIAGRNRSSKIHYLITIVLPGRKTRATAREHYKEPVWQVMK